MVFARLTTLCVAAAAIALAHLDVCTALSDYAVPSVDYAALTSSPDARAALLRAMQTDGIVALRNVPDYAGQRTLYLAKAASCAVVSEQNKAEFLLHRKLTDGTRRLTISTESGRKLSESGHETLTHCPGYFEAYQTFSQLVEDAVSGVGKALDATQALHITSGNQVALTARELVDESVHLDHFHAYEAAADHRELTPTSTSDIDDDSKQLSLEMHMDNGLMIAMTAPEYFDVADSGDVRAKHTRSEDAGLVIQTAHGETVRPVLVADELVLMLGSGADQWITTSPKLQPVLHGMRFPRGLSYGDDDEATTHHKVLRAWFGKMILLHADAVMANTGMSYGVYANHTTRYLMESNTDLGFAAVACPPDRRLQASDSKCMTQVCTAKAGGDAASMPESCQVTCNHESPDDAQLCQKNCVCETQSVAGHRCWMLCVADLSTDVCPGPQKCNDASTTSKLAMTCAAGTVAPTTPSAITTLAPVKTPAPTSTAKTKTSAPAATSPSASTTKPTPTTKKPSTASSSSRAGSSKGTTTAPKVVGSNSRDDLSIDDAGVSANANASSSSSTAGPTNSNTSDTVKSKNSAAPSNIAATSLSVVAVSVIATALLAFAPC